MIQSNNSNSFLKYVLRLNATFSLTSGILISLFFHKVSDIMGFNSPVILNYMGPILCGFAIYVWMYASRQTRSHIKMIIFQDLLWVLGSIILLFTDPFGISVIGLWLIAIVALIVLDFALLQTWGLWRMDRSADGKQ